MKIVFLSHFDANLYLFRLPIMEALVKRGWEVIALCPQGEYHHRFKEHNITHIPYKIDRGSLNPFKEIVTIKRIESALKTIQPNLLHTFTVKPNIYGLIAARLAGVQTTVSSVTGLGSFFIEQDFKSRTVRRIITTLYRTLFTFASAITFQNSDDRKLFIQEGLLDASKSVLIKGSGIDTNLWSPEPREENDRFTVLYIGRLLIHKGIGEFLEAAKALKGRGIRFVVAGDFYDGNPYNYDQEAFQTLVREGVVEFVGWITDIKPLIASCDLFVLPSYREGMPRTGIEAASMGKPLIVADAVGCREVVEHGVNGYLTPIGDSKEIIQYIQRLHASPSQCKALGEASREKALREFDVQAIVNEHIKLYETLLTDKKR